MGLFDVHAHLTSPRLIAEEQQVVDRARAAGVTTIVSNGLNPADNAATLALAARHDIVKPAIGLYPVDAVLPQMEALGVEYPREPGDLPAAEDAVAWVRDHVGEAFAVGEIGLDHHWVPQELWGAQEQVFRQLIRIAKAADKAIIIHTRKAERRALEVVLEEGHHRVNWHCMSTKVKFGRRIVSHPGQYISIPAHVRKADNFRRLLETLPRDRILLETDCPYLSPVRGTVNEPANVAGTVALAAELWGWSEADVVDQLAANFTALFGEAP